MDAIDLEGMIGFLARLVAHRSLGGHETEIQETVAAQMIRSGMDVDRWRIDLDEVRRHPEHSEEIQRREGVGLVGRLGGKQEERSLILNGHVDVVPAGDRGRWRYPPWNATITDRRIYGRGTADMKGGLCSALFAVKAVRDAGVGLEGPVSIQSVIGEEDGGTGTLATLLRGHTASAAVVMEPTNLAVLTAQAGALNFRIRVAGSAAHGSTRTEGISAVEKLVPLLGALSDLEAKRNVDTAHPLMSQLPLPYPISVGVVRAGEWASTVPETAICEGRYGVAVGESATHAKREFEKAVLEMADRDPWMRTHPPRIDWWGGRFESAETARDSPIVGTVEGAIRSLTGRRPEVSGAPYGADMRLLVGVGHIPTVLFGPGDVRWAHRSDEFVLIDDLVIAVRALALTVLRFCGTGEDGDRP